MSSSLAVIRRACLVLGLLATVSSAALAQAFTGCPMFTPSSLNFGNQALSTTSAPQTVTVFCPSTSGGICNSPIVPVIVGPAAADFALATSMFPCPTTLLGPGGQCEVNVTFTPSLCGPRVAFLVLTAPGFPVGNCGIIPLQGVGTFTPVVGPPITFPSACAGELGASITLTLPANTIPSIVGPGNFSITATNCPQPATTCTVTIRFNPLAAACGTVTSTLQLTSTLTGCVVATFELSGFACSFTCAIGLAGTASLTTAGRRCVLDSLNLAAISTGLTRCAALRCAECCALSDLALRPAGSAARASIQAVLDQIHCLQACFGCAPFPC